MAKMQPKQNAEHLFNQADYASLRTARQQLNNLVAVLDKAQACGVDVSMYRSMRQDIDDQLAQIEQHFMQHLAGGKVKS